MIYTTKNTTKNTKSAWTNSQEDQDKKNWQKHEDKENGVSLFQYNANKANIEDRACIELIDCETPNNLKYALHETFKELEIKAQALNEQEQETEVSKEKPPESGSTACILLAKKDNQERIGFIVANLGDSGAVLLIEKDDKSLLRIKLTEDQEPDLKRIAKKITEKGGIVSFYWDTQRVDDWLATGGALGDGKIHAIKEPDIFDFTPDSALYTKIEKICEAEGIKDLQACLRQGKARLVSFSDGIYWKKAQLEVDYQVTINEETEEVNIIKQVRQETDKYNDYFGKNKGFIFNEEELEQKKADVGKPDDITVVSYNPAKLEKGKAMVVGVFDGHNGAGVATMAANELLPILKQSMSKIYEPEKQADNRGNKGNQVNKSSKKKTLIICSVALAIGAALCFGLNANKPTTDKVSKELLCGMFLLACALGCFIAAFCTSKTVSNKLYKVNTLECGGPVIS